MLADPTEPALPFDEIWLKLTSLTTDYWVSLLLGFVIVLSFASARYDLPTWTKTSLGNLAQLSPKSLAPDYRYRKGFILYLVLMVGTYLALCILGPKILDGLGVAAASGFTSPELWPMGAATTLAVTGAVADDKFPGLIEGYFRRKAHEAAFIPTAVKTLSTQLATFNLGDWLRRLDQEQRDHIQALVGGSDVCPLDQVAHLAEGKLVSWVRGNALLYCFTELSGERYGAIKEQEENREALRLLSALRTPIAARLPNFAAGSSENVIEAALAKDIDSFLQDASILLAATLLQAAPNARQLAATINTLGFDDVDSTGRQTWFELGLFVVSIMSIAIAMAWLLADQFTDQFLELARFFRATSTTLSEQDVGDLPLRLSRTAITTIVTYSIMLVVFMYVREHWLAKTRWEEKLGTYIRFAFFAGLMALIATWLATLLMPGVEFRREFIRIIGFNIVVVMIAASFFVVHIRGAARIPQRGWPMLGRALMPTPIVHALVAAVLVGLVAHYVEELRNSSVEPTQAITEANNHIEALEKNLANTSTIPRVKDWLATKLASTKLQLKEISSEWKPEVSEDKLKAMQKKIGDVCDSLNNGNEGVSLFNEPGPNMHSCVFQPPMTSALQLHLDDNFYALGRSLEELWENFLKIINSRSSNAAQLVNLQTFIAIVFSVVAALALGASLRFARALQLSNQLDDLDEGLVKRLKERATTHFRERGENVDIDKWLVTANESTMMLTPLEAIRYHFYRSSLFDSLPIKPQEQSGQPPIRIVATGGGS